MNHLGELDLSLFGQSCFSWTEQSTGGFQLNKRIYKFFFK